ncbi:hypothetical protein DSL64_02100 [Dyadobacter luteus]|uniref:Uncharacterized protein n=1 Tax=Dyadobacter luteus TaxID=2259619 RepID=A0A3D8YI57_9BACT|nr:hypothetical protein DSL64_02100 [Dyadobacter luteus]
MYKGAEGILCVIPLDKNIGRIFTELVSVQIHTCYPIRAVVVAVIRNLLYVSQCPPENFIFCNNHLFVLFACSRSANTKNNEQINNLKIYVLRVFAKISASIKWQALRIAEYKISMGN